MIKHLVKPSNKPRGASLVSRRGVGVFVLAMGLANGAWANEQSLQALQFDPPAPVADGADVQAQAETLPRRAPAVDLEQPLQEPLQASAQSLDQTDTLSSNSGAESGKLALAKSVDLGKPVTDPQLLHPEEGQPDASAQSGSNTQQPVAQPVDVAAEVLDTDAATVAETAVESATEADSAVVDSADKASQPRSAADAQTKPADQQPRPQPPLVMLGAEVAPGTSTRLSWSPSHSFEGIEAPTPVLVVNGAKDGPVLCLTAAVHGDELNGIEIVRRVLYNLNAKKLSGAVIGVPIVNLQGFRRGSRYLPDRRDLNRFFPGDPRGSSAARIAHSFFHEVITHCDALVDLHTGSFYRTNLPQLRADLRQPEVLELSQGFDGTVVLQSDGAAGTLRLAAVAAGIPAVTLEAGEPMRLQEKEVNHGVKTVQSLLGKMGMIKKSSFWGQAEPIYYQSAWVRADQGGILFSEVDLGERVREKELLGTVTDPITNVRTEILSPYSGRVLGMALNQVVMPGFAAFRIGMESSESEVIETVDPELEAAATLHTSQLEKERPAALPASEPAPQYVNFEGLEDSE